MRPAPLRRSFRNLGNELQLPAEREQLLADLHQDWPAVLDRLLEQARSPTPRPPSTSRPGADPAGREKWASLLDDTPSPRPHHPSPRCRTVAPAAGTLTPGVPGRLVGD
ncbi:hypothetical protein ACFVH7_18265 [Kitasatospora indigofera]|uniref:hypothetical protein n=1 Tax=Kitasatospora indigofera TaxID=67307 RepID=UPI0036360B8F